MVSDGSRDDHFAVLTDMAAAQKDATAAQGMLKPSM
jgi:hypothetical protein